MPVIRATRVPNVNFNNQNNQNRPRPRPRKQSTPFADGFRFSIYDD